ncbi:hypothetical protein A7X67_05520 [Clostridium sp. W14A]|nr:hypothetical protein A7X67_05520 [Clostridium sp. W14A]
MPSTGTYQIDYYINITAGTGASLSIAVNGTPDASTTIDLLVGTGVVSGTAMLTLAGGDVLTLRNSSGATAFTLGTSVSSQFDVIFLS